MGGERTYWPWPLPSDGGANDPARNHHGSGMMSLPSAARARLTRIAAEVRVLVWEYDLQHSRFKHHVACEVFGAHALPRDLRLRQALRLVHAQDRREVLARARAAIEHRSPYVQHFRLAFDCSGAADAVAVWVEHHGAVLCNLRGQARWLVGTMIDITAHRRALDALAMADRRKEEFLATLAHELRNPVTAISVAARLLRGVRLDSEPMSHCVNIITRQSAHLGRLMDDLLDLSHVVRNRLELRRERLDLRDSIRTAVESTGEQLRMRHHRLHILLPEQRMPLNADPVRLSQLFGNLLSNAIKYTPLGGQIEIRAQCSGDWAEVRVRDSGLGIAAEHLPYVFEPFYQVDHSLAHAQGGLGIGLALVRRIAQLHDGSVGVHSDGPGQGSEFTVRLPLLAEQTTLTEGGPAVNIPRTAQPLRVLVAEDDADVAATLSLSLQMMGHEVRVSLDGEEALRVAEQFRPQAALLDVGMPRRAGHEVARELRSRPWAAENGLLLVALSGWNARELRDRIDMSAFDATMMKPPDIDALRRVLEGAPREPNAR